MKLLSRKLRILPTFNPNDVEVAIEFAKQEFKLNSGDESGSIRDKLNNVWKQTGKKPKELEELIELPDSCHQVWSWFISLNNARSNSGFGVSPISYTEIKNFFELMHIVPDEWEVILIKSFDAVAMKQFSEDMVRQNKKNSK